MCPVFYTLFICILAVSVGETTALQMPKKNRHGCIESFNSLIGFFFIYTSDFSHNLFVTLFLLLPPKTLYRQSVVVNMTWESCVHSCHLLYPFSPVSLNLFYRLHMSNLCSFFGTLFIGLSLCTVSLLSGSLFPPPACGYRSLVNLSSLVISTYHKVILELLWFCIFLFLYLSAL